MALFCVATTNTVSQAPRNSMPEAFAGVDSRVGCGSTRLKFGPTPRWVKYPESRVSLAPSLYRCERRVGRRKLLKEPPRRFRPRRGHLRDTDSLSSLEILIQDHRGLPQERTLRRWGPSSTDPGVSEVTPCAPPSHPGGPGGQGQWEEGYGSVDTGVEWWVKNTC